MQYLRNSIVGEHTQFVDVSEIPVRSVVETGPEVGDKDLCTFVEFERFGIAICWKSRGDIVE
jgi:hypothetical protein